VPCAGVGQQLLGDMAARLGLLALERHQKGAGAAWSGVQSPLSPPVKAGRGVSGGDEHEGCR